MQMQVDYKVINMDQWMGFFRFVNEVNLQFTLSILLITLFVSSSYMSNLVVI